MKKSANSRTEVVLPSSVICKFLNQDGIDAGSPVEMPVEATTKQLEVLLNTLLGNADQLPYAFYVNGTEVVSSLSDSLNQMIAESADSVSFEDYLNISYQPLSVYRVRPVSRCVETMPGHTDAVLHVSYSPDGKRLASGGGDLAVRFWDVTTSMPLHTCLGHSHHVLCTIWAPDGSVFVSADRSGEIRLWNPTNGLQRGRAMKGHSKWITSLSFEPFHRDHRCIRLASASKDHTIVIWNLATCTSEAVICGHTDSVECVKWGGSGLIYSCSRDRTIKVWAIDDPGRNQHKLVRTLTGHAHRINSLALNSDYVLRTGPFNLGDRISSVLDLDEDVSGKQTRALERYTTMVGSVGETLVSCSDDFTLFLWKPQESKTPITRMTGHQQIVNHIAFSPDGRFIASASFDKKIKLWCGLSGRFLSTLTGHVGAVYQVSWSPDSHYLVSCSKDSTLKLWTLKDTKKAFATLPGHMDEVYALDWSPSGSMVASGSKDRTIKIWQN